MSGIPGVNVFHSKSTKISSAKIRKYQTASEKGISVYQEVFDPPPGSVLLSSPSITGTPSSTGPPPAKKPRLTLKNSNPGPALSPATVAVTRRKRKPRQIDLNVDMTFEDGITSVMEPEPVSSPEPESDDESPLSSPPSSVKETPEEREPTPEDAGYDAGNMLSYYIRDDPEDAKKAAPAPPVKAPKPTKKPKSPKHAPPPPVQDSQLHPSQTRAPNHVPKPRQPSSRPATNPPPQQALPPLPAPTINIFNNIRHNFDPSAPPPLAEIIARVEILSEALIRFGRAQGGVQPTRQPDRYATQGEYNNNGTASANRRSTATSAQDQNDESVDDLLAMFEVDDEADSPSGGEGSNNSDFRLSTNGTPDDALIYGIEFIMNALRTWAEQRINSSYAQQWYQYNELRRMQQPQPRKGRGRPTKYELEQREAAPQQPPPPSVINAGLTSTPEGQAVQAFQDVLDIGVLRINAVYPKELSAALRSVYVQVDNLINVNPNTHEEPPWQCMSYQPQIITQRIKVERWKEHMAKMQAEMVRQQELSHQQMMQQMGVPLHLQHHGTMTDEQAARHRDMSLELKRGGQHAASQPHLTQYLTTPMDLDSQTPNNLAKSSTPKSPANATAGAASIANPLNTHQITGNVSHTSTSSRNREPFSAVKMYIGAGGTVPGLSAELQAKLESGAMRRDQGFKFSFPATNPESVRAFGQEAFPPASQGSSIPRRGPMSKPAEQHNVANGPNESTPTPVLPSNATSMGPPPMRRGSNNQVNGATVSGASSKVAAATNVVVNGQNSGAARRASSSQAASPVDSTAYTHKRKRSETVNNSAPASPAPKKQGSTSSKISQSEKAMGEVNSISPDNAIVVE